MATEQEGTVTTVSGGATPVIVTPEPKVEERKITDPKAGDPEWINDRIVQAKRSAKAEILKEAGVETVEQMKAAVVAAKAKEEAEKSAELRATELKAKTDALEAKSATQQKMIGEFASRQMVGLTPEQQEAVKAIAGEDPERQLVTIQALTPTWTKKESAGGTEPKPAATTSTAPNPNAPQSEAQSKPDPRATYETMRQTNPFAAAEFARQNPAVYDGAKTKT